MQTTLINRNVLVKGHRTSMRLEPEFWTALDHMATKQQRHRDDVVDEIARDRGNGTLTSAVRVAVLKEFRK